MGLELISLEENMYTLSSKPHAQTHQKNWQTCALFSLSKDYII